LFSAHITTVIFNQINFNNSFYMRKYVVEFIGTFFLVLAVCSAIFHNPDNNFAPLAIGFALVVMVYAGGHLSGAHYNPAVSLAVFIRGKMTMVEMIGYWVVQLMGGVIAALVATKLFKYTATPAAPAETFGAIVAELIGTFGLAYVILNVATSPKTANNHYYGLAIGFTVVAMAYAVGPVSGGAFNPAVALGLSVFEKIEWGSLWIYLVGAFGGAILAALLYRILRLDIE
jgi:aquaporin Z